MINHQIQLADSVDWDEIKKICAETGQAGTPVSADRAGLFATLWVGPYETISDNYSLALVCKTECIQGYLVGTTDSKIFRAWKTILFDIPLVIKILLRRYPYNSDAKRFVRRFFKLEKSPECSFPKDELVAVEKLYPAHLHMNFLPQGRGQGLGRSIFLQFRDLLKEQNVPGIHVFCGKTSKSFYLKVGFSEFSKIEFRPGVFVYLMTYKINY